MTIHLVLIWFLSSICDQLTDGNCILAVVGCHLAEEELLIFGCSSSLGVSSRVKSKKSAMSRGW